MCFCRPMLEGLTQAEPTEPIIIKGTQKKKKSTDTENTLMILWSLAWGGGLTLNRL